jgi:hypothetical protein
VVEGLVKEFPALVRQMKRNVPLVVFATSGTNDSADPGVRLGLCDLLNLTVADAGSAGAKTLVRSVDDSAHGLNVDVPAAVAHVMGVTDLMPELRAFAAYFTYSCHFLQ